MKKPGVSIVTPTAMLVYSHLTAIAHPITLEYHVEVFVLRMHNNDACTISPIFALKSGPAKTGPTILLATAGPAPPVRLVQF